MNRICLGFGSKYMFRSIQAVLQFNKQSYICQSIDKRLLSEEQRFASKKLINTTQIGVYAPKFKPVYPFTDEEEKILKTTSNIQKPSMHERYLSIAQKSRGSNLCLYTPILQEIITSMLILQFRIYNNPIRELNLPTLVEISDVGNRKLNNFPFVSAGFWGSQNNDELLFACCTFEIDKQFYENVWIELSLLVITPVYTTVAKATYFDIVGQFWKSSVENAETILDIYILDKTNSYIKRLLKKNKA
jgi:hypothetical protein